MVGNDIIDLAFSKAQKNFSRPRAWKKIFTAHEQELIVSAANPNLSACQIWSIKESAYKLYSQTSNRRFFRPDKFECYLNENEGKVQYMDFICSTKTESTEDYIFTEAYFDDDTIRSSCFRLSNQNHKTQSLESKDRLLREFAKQIGYDKGDLTIKKSVLGVPSIYYQNTRLKHSVSLSHHGRFGAFSYAI